MISSYPANPLAWFANKLSLNNSTIPGLRILRISYVRYANIATSRQQQMTKKAQERHKNY